MIDHTSSAAQAKLAQLLIDLLSVDELRRFVRLRYPNLAPDLSEGPSLRVQVESLVELLRRHGELDDDFFAGLRGERGKRTAEIDDIAALFLSRGPGGHASTEATPLDAPILELERRIAALAQDGLDAQQERAELLQLRGQRRAYPAPARGLLLAGRYTLDIELGHGGFASVWRAQDREAHRRVALKILHSHHAGDRIRRDRFARGMRTMRSLDHPNILRVHEPEVSANGFVFAVLELVSGGDLHEAFRNHQLPPDQIWPILLAICDGLGLVHDRNLVHRDIKPGNILLTETGTPFLTDFDLVLDHETAGGTRTGALGSVVYTPPELWHDAHQATAAADVYSLAMTAVFAYQGAHPSPNIIRDLNAELDELDLTPALRDVLRHALAWRPEDRYPDARALGKALQAALAGSTSFEAAPADPLADHDILYWIADDRGRAETVWLTSTDRGVKVIDRAPGIALAAGERVWRLARETRQFAGCDVLFGGEEVILKVAALPVDAADLVEVGGGLRVPLGLFTEPSDLDIPIGTELDFPEETATSEFDHSVLVTFSAGPFLFVRSTQYAYTFEAAHGSTGVGFDILDLRSGGACDLLSANERADLEQELSGIALAQLRSEHGDGAVSDFDIEPDVKPPTLTMYYAHYDIEGKLQLSYQFTEETFYASSDNQWDDYTWSTRVTAPRLPAALADLGTAPRLLQQHWQTAPHHAGSHGWTAAPRTSEIHRRLRQCFAELNGPALE